MALAPRGARQEITVAAAQTREIRMQLAQPPCILDQPLPQAVVRACGLDPRAQSGCQRNNQAAVDSLDGVPVQDRQLPRSAARCFGIPETCDQIARLPVGGAWRGERCCWFSGGSLAVRPFRLGGGADGSFRGSRFCSVSVEDRAILKGVAVATEDPSVRWLLLFHGDPGSAVSAVAMFRDHNPG